MFKPSQMFFIVTMPGFLLLLLSRLYTVDDESPDFSANALIVKFFIWHNSIILIATASLVSKIKLLVIHQCQYSKRQMTKYGIYRKAGARFFD